MTMNGTLECKLQQTIETIEVMRVNEAKNYGCSDYLQHNSGGIISQSCIPHGPLSPDDEPVDADCRQKMANWSYSVVDFCGFNRETVAVAMSYLDRYLSSNQEALQDRKKFQLIAMTCLYTAVKVHEPEAMEPELVVTMSNGMYSVEEIQSTEKLILYHLKYFMNPPTPISFVRQFVDLIPSGTLGKEEIRAAAELATFQCELAVHDYDLPAAGVKASCVAYAALANALQCTKMSPPVKHDFLDIVSKVAGIDVIHDVETLIVQDKLLKAVESSVNGEDGATTLMPQTNEYARCGSPRTIACDPHQPSSPTGVYDSAPHFMKNSSFVGSYE